jgi:CRISPR-associated protein Cas5t
MLGLKVTVPVACFRKGFAREYWETEELPPPSTCYGFLLSLVGERDRRAHIGAKVSPGLLNRPDKSIVLRTLWRVKTTKSLPGAGTNARPDYQELLSGTELVIWLDSSEETSLGPSLEARVAVALDHPERIDRFGGLCLGESTHMVDEVRRLRPDDIGPSRTYLIRDRGRITLPVWVDHVGTAGTRYATGDLVEMPMSDHPLPDRMPKIEPLEVPAKS